MSDIFLADYMKKAEELGFTPDQAVSFVKATLAELSPKSASDDDKKVIDMAEKVIEHEKSEIKDENLHKKMAGYIEGFVKRANEHGLSNEDSIKLLKSALVPEALDYLNSHPELAHMLALGGGGAAMGGLGGAALSGPEHKGRNAAIGALAGGAGGLGLDMANERMLSEANTQKNLVDWLRQAQTGKGMPAGTGLFKNMMQ